MLEVWLRGTSLFLARVQKRVSGWKVLERVAYGRCMETMFRNSGGVVQELPQ